MVIEILNENWNTFALARVRLILVKKVTYSSSRAWPFFRVSHAPDEPITFFTKTNLKLTRAKIFQFSFKISITTIQTFQMRYITFLFFKVVMTYFSKTAELFCVGRILSRVSVNWKLLLFLSSNKLDPLISWKRIICMIISQSVCLCL